MAEVARPAFARLGATFTTKLNAWGWTPAGGGEMEVAIEPIKGLEAIEEWTIKLEDWQVVNGVAAVTNLRINIAQRMAQRTEKLLSEEGITPQITAVRERGRSPGSGISLWITQAGFDALGKKRMAAEKVAETAVTQLLDFMENGADVDKYLADQLLMPLSLASGPSKFTADQLTLHTVTNADLLRQWLNVDIDIQGNIGQTAEITVEGISFLQD
jgi:RNA 3'-terminal phosphate cyclase (ATP)